MPPKINKNRIQRELVNKVINDIRHMHYLGSGNISQGPEYDLSRYYRNAARQVFVKEFSDGGMIAADKLALLFCSTLTYAGTGTCGELASALLVYLLLSPELTNEQKQTISISEYPTNDDHISNTYVLVGDTVYDVWAKKEYNVRNIKNETGTDIQRHNALHAEKYLAAQPLSELNKLFQDCLAQFTEKFEEKLASDRANNEIYPTLDLSNNSNYALFAEPVFTYLHQKYKETLTEIYYLEHRELAKSIRNKIVRDFTFLIEELRQDRPLSADVANKHPGRTKESEETVNAALSRAIPNDSEFLNFIISQTKPKSHTNVSITKVIDNGQHPIFQSQLPPPEHEAVTNIDEVNNLDIGSARLCSE